MRLVVSQQTRRQEGFGLLEILTSMMVITVVLMALGQLMVVSVRTNSVNNYRVEVLNQARAKLEEIRSVSYDQVGILPTEGAKGLGYYETDPFYEPTFGADDVLLSDKVVLSVDGESDRFVTVEAVDDPADSSGGNDWDGVKDPNTGTILDYKIVTVSIQATDPFSGEPFVQELSTILIGTLDGEVDASGDTDKGKKAPKDKKDKKGKKDKGAKDGKSKKGRSGKSDTTED